MVFISHDLSVVRYLADRVVVMYLGHILEMGATEQIFAPPFHPYTEALLSAIPIADSRVKKRHVVLEGEIPSALSPPSGCPFQTRCGHKRDGPGQSVRAGNAADPNRRRRPHDQVPSAGRGARSAWSRCSHDAAPEPRGGDRARRAGGPRRRFERRSRARRSRGRPSPPTRTAKARAASPISSTISPPRGRAGSTGDAEPVLTSPAPAAIHCDASGGIAQLGFDRVFDDLCRRAETFGIALFSPEAEATPPANSAITRAVSPRPASSLSPRPAGLR